jgi:hypothetical protein
MVSLQTHKRAALLINSGTFSVAAAALLVLSVLLLWMASIWILKVALLLVMPHSSTKCALTMPLIPPNNSTSLVLPNALTQMLTSVAPWTLPGSISFGSNSTTTTAASKVDPSTTIHGTPGLQELLLIPTFVCSLVFLEVPQPQALATFPWPISNQLSHLFVHSTPHLVVL